MSQNPKPLPPVENLRSALDYNHENGVLKWRHRDDMPSSWNARFAGREAGHSYTNTNQPHYRGKVVGFAFGGQNHLYQAHRLAWKMMTGKEPPKEIDHINGNSMDNRWENLRDGSNGVNGKNRKKYRNNTSGVTGVSKRGDGWRARVRVGGDLHSLGTFVNIEDAERAVLQHRSKNGFTESHGKRGEAVTDHASYAQRGQYNGDRMAQPSKGAR